MSDSAAPAEEQLLVQLYRHVSRALDQLPYTDEFDWMHESFEKKTGHSVDRNVFFRRLTNLRKDGRLPRKGMKQ